MEMSVLPEFGKIQFEGFHRFIHKGLIEELNDFPKIEDPDQEFEFELFGGEFRLAKPIMKERKAIYQSDTYSSDLYVPARLTQKKGGGGSIPLMNSQGTFVVNGVARVIINQILRSPVLLLAMGLTTKQILGGVCYPKFFLDSLRRKKTKREHPQSTEDAIVELYRQLYCIGGDLTFSESIRRIGRLNLNKRLDLDVPESEYFLLPQDVLAAVDYLIKTKFGTGTLDDVDHLKNRRIRSVANLLWDQFRLALNRLENSVRQTIHGATKRKRLPTPKSLVTSTQLIATFKEFFGSHPLSQFLDQTNPLTEIVHKRRLSSLGPGGLTRRTASFQVRDIHPSHYGRICPIETSEGMNAGLIASLAVHARVNTRGSLETPFYKISEISREEGIIHLLTREDEYHRIAIGIFLALDQRTRKVQGGKIHYTDSGKVTLSVSNNKRVDTNLIIYQRSNNSTCVHQESQVNKNFFLKKGQLIADGATTSGGELALGKNVLVAYMPWEGYNFEDAILISERLIYEDIYTSIHIEKYEIEARTTNRGPEKITREIPHLESNILRHLDKSGLVLSGSWVETGDVLVGKLTPQEAEESLRAPEGKLLQAIFGIQVATARETCLKVPPGGKGRVIDVKWIYQKDTSINHEKKVRVYILQKRKIQVGDKVVGRHGNKGIISKNLPRRDMPYLQDGTPIDMVLSPLGVPSRMNAGQIFECSLGLSGYFSKKHYRITPFDERYEREASRKLVFSELYEASKKTENPGKNRLIDGRTGEIFEQPVTVGKAYMLKLIHQVDDKIHARSSGPYALVTQQPLRGRSRRGGQRVGEMEVWALEGFGVAYILREMLTIKSDHIRARYEVLGAIVIGEPIPEPNTVPESFRLLVRELRSLALGLDHVVVSEKNLKRILRDV
ncbi:hypothetical protein CY35_20G008200 [Sphagnum magellanicum]|nr:hypothetical protein CY35_20G008200 [Sphagnum magellanicum]